MAQRTYIQDRGAWSVLKEGTAIYRGKTDAFEVNSSGAFLRRSMLTGGNTYFGIDPESTTANYGITAKLVLNSDVKVWNMNSLPAYKDLEGRMRQSNATEALEALHRSFPIESGKIHRDSVSKYDRKVVEFQLLLKGGKGRIPAELSGGCVGAGADFLPFFHRAVINELS